MDWIKVFAPMNQAAGCLFDQLFKFLLSVVFIVTFIISLVIINQNPIFMKTGSLVTFKNPVGNEYGQIWQIIEMRGNTALCQWKNANMILQPTNVFLLSDLVLINN